MTRAKEHSMHANTGFPVAEKNGELVREAYSDIYVSRDESNQLQINFEKGGGHLGAQGYGSSEAFRSSAQRLDLESYEYTHLIGNWWCYDGIYD